VTFGEKFRRALVVALTMLATHLISMCVLEYVDISTSNAYLLGIFQASTVFVVFAIVQKD